MHRQDINNLKFRYLLWLYKTTREGLDRIERKFTQLDIDRDILGYIVKHLDSLKVKDKHKLDKFIKQFREYIDRKEKDGLDLKFDGRKLKSEYYYSLVKLKAIEKSIVKQLGQKAKGRIKMLYEQETIRRILESKEHR